MLISFGRDEHEMLGGKTTAKRPPKDHRRVKRLRVENECFVLFCNGCCTFCWLSTCCNYFKEGTQNPHTTHREGAKSRHRQEIADGCCNFTFAKVKNSTKNTFVKVNFVGIFGINSKNIIIFLE